MNRTQKIATRLAVMALGTFLLAGCSPVTNLSVASAPAGVSLRGHALGGQMPVAGGTVQLWAASSSGYGAASTPLITPESAAANHAAYPVTTDAGGNFTITGDFTCPTPSSTPVYLTIMGGNPGNGGGQANSNLGLMAALGPCNNLVNIPFVNVSELSTVASVWALAPFMTAYDHVGTSTTNATGLVNAFAAVNKLYNIGSGAVGGPALPAGAVLPVDEINAIGDILATCVNSTGGAAGDTDSRCGDLFSATKFGTAAPTDTIGAALSMAQHPGNNVPAIYNLLPSVGAVFATNLSQQPNAWTIAIQYTYNRISNPRAITADANGNIWTASANNGQINKLDNSGAGVSLPGALGLGIYRNPTSLALDPAGSIWISTVNADIFDEPYNIAVTSPNGVTVQGYATSQSHPVALTFDSQGYVWIANQGSSSVSKINVAVSGSSTNVSTNITSPTALAVEPASH